MVYGDSISAGYGLPQGAGWVVLLEQRLQHEHYDYKVINASLSGETTLGGVARLKEALARHQPQIVILELGANDGLRGARIDGIRTNLAAMIAESRKQRAQVLLVGMELPPNYGMEYTTLFRALYPALAKAQRVALVPFLLAGFAANRELFQADGIHPNASAQPRMLDNVWPHLRPLLERGARR